MSSRHSTGFTCSLARNSCVDTSMRGNVPYAVEGWNFFLVPQQHNTAWLFLMGFIALPDSLTEFSSPTRCTGFTDSPPVDYVIAEAQYYHRELPTPPRFHFMVILPCSPLSDMNFVELCNIFVYCRANYFSSLISTEWYVLHPSAALDSLYFEKGGKRVFSLFIELCNIFYFRANYFRPGTNAVLSHGSRDS